MLSPPARHEERWFAPHTAYTMAKFGMSMCVLGLAGELGAEGHRRQCSVAAHRHRDRRCSEPARRRGLMRQCRKPDIMADAAYAIFSRPSREFTGQFPDRRQSLAAERRERVRSLPGRSDAAADAQDFFVPDEIKPPPGVSFEPLTR